MRLLLTVIFFVFFQPAKAQLPYWWRTDHLASWIVTDTYQYDVADTLVMWLINPGPDTVVINQVELPGGVSLEAPQQLAPGDTGKFRMQVRYYGVGEGVKIFDHRVTVRANRYVPVISQFTVLVNTNQVGFNLDAEGNIASLTAASLPMPYQMRCHSNGALHEVGEVTPDGSKRLGTWLSFSASGDLLQRTNHTSIAALYGYADSLWNQVALSFRCDSCHSFSPVLAIAAQYGSRYVYLPTDGGILRMDQEERWAEWVLHAGRQPLVTLFPQAVLDSASVYYRSSHNTNRILVDTTKAVLRAAGCWQQGNCSGQSVTFFDYAARYSAAEPALFRRYMEGWCVIAKPDSLDFDAWLVRISQDTLFQEVGWLAGDAIVDGQDKLAFFGRLYLLIDPITIPNSNTMQDQLQSLGLSGGEVIQGTYVATTMPLRWKGLQAKLQHMESLPWVKGMQLSLEGNEVLPEDDWKY